MPGLERTRAQIDWTPPDTRSEILLRDAYTAMPIDPGSPVPWPVRALEHPRSPLALPGAIELFGHDCLHLVLGRGLLPQDEAFVLGFTMGTVRAHRRAHVTLYTWCARWLYRGVFRFTKSDAEVFALGAEAGRASGAAPLPRVDFYALLDEPLPAIRRTLGICPARLAGAYALERRRFPHTRASARLAASTTRSGAAIWPP